MNELKKQRVEALNNCLQKINELTELYNKGSVAWSLIESAWGHINSLHHLESDTNFDDKMLGVK